jgi:hypothetical protein
MKTQRPVHNGSQGAGFKPPHAVRVAVMGLLFVAALPLAAQDKTDTGTTKPRSDRNSIGFIASKEASAKEVGLPLYPGARPHKDESNDSPAVQLGLWGGPSGFKLVVLKLESNDAPEKVAAFYRKALAKYGKVLDCTDSSRAAGLKGEGDSSHELGCEEDRPESGELLLKAGTKEEQHLVGIKPNAGRSVFQLVYLEARGSDTDK